MVAQSLIIASEITGFISFAVTLLTLLGVYRDLLSTVRHAPTQIPIMLGNLRQEILAEKAFLQYRIKQGDEYRVFPRKLQSIGGSTGLGKGRRGRIKGGKGMEATVGGVSKQGFSKLMEATIKDIWIEFRNVERPFLIRNPMTAERVEKGGLWGEDDVEEDRGEKPKGRRKRGRKGDEESFYDEKGGRERDEDIGQPMRMTKQGIAEVGARYYRTDLAHRWIWWQTQSSVVRLMDQVQRIQIRRLERDVFETDELVKRMYGRGGGEGSVSGSGSDSGGGGGRRSGSARSVRSRGSVRSVRMPSRAGSRAGRNFREVEEVERVRRSMPSPSRDIEASNTGRRRERRSGPRVEYEIVRPGTTYVVDDGYPRPPRRSYSRDR